TDLHDILLALLDRCRVVLLVFFNLSLSPADAKYLSSFHSVRLLVLKGLGLLIPLFLPRNVDAVDLSVNDPFKEISALCRASSSLYSKDSVVAGFPSSFFPMLYECSTIFLSL